MLEQQLAERFRAAVHDEPPLTVDPDELVDRLLRTRRRKLGMATALGVVMVATIAVGGAAAAGGERAATQPPASSAATTPTTTRPPASPGATTIAATVPAGAYDIRAEPRKQEAVRSVSTFLVDTVPTDVGTLEIRRDGYVLFRAELALLDAYVFRPAEPVVLKPGQRVVVAVKCLRTRSRAGGCHVDVTFSVLVVAR